MAEGWLVLSRQRDQEIVIAGQIRVRVVEIRKNTVRIGVMADPSIVVDRLEIHEAKMKDQTDKQGV